MNNTTMWVTIDWLAAIAVQIAQFANTNSSAKSGAHPVVVAGIPESNVQVTTRSYCHGEPVHRMLVVEAGASRYVAQITGIVVGAARARTTEARALHSFPRASAAASGNVEAFALIISGRQ
jgi:hypothetical protein